MGILKSCIITCLLCTILSTPTTSQVSTDVNDLRFIYFPTADQGVEIQYGVLDSLNESNIRASTPTVLIIDGFLSNLTTPMSVNVKNAFVNVGNVNVIVLDWGRLSGSGQSTIATFPVVYNTVLANVPPTGQRAADFLNFLSVNLQIPFSDITIVGHSLGAHVAGDTGKAVKSTYGGLLGRISGLDPAGPMYHLQLDPSKRLDKSDASFVDVYHTNRGGLGIIDDIGTVNVYVNGGTSQTGCETADATGSFVGYCSHSYSWKFYITAFNTLITACPCGVVTCLCKTLCNLSCSNGIPVGPGIPNTVTGTYLASYGPL